MNSNNNLLRSVLKPPTKRILPKKNIISSKLDFSPLHWSEFFEECRDLEVVKSSGKFRVYLNGFKQNSNAPIIVLLHGGGYSATTWSLFVKSLIEICDCRIVAIDLRGHGSSTTANDYDLSIHTLVDDVFNILVCLFTETDNDHHSMEVCSQTTSGQATMADVAYNPVKEQVQLPPLCLCGHSMGGALAVHAAYKLSTVCSITGLIVIDVVEGTALDALQSMHLVLKNRQSSFDTIRDAIEWCVRNNQTKNIDAARISFPGQIKNRFTNQLATDECEEMISNDHSQTKLSSNDTDTNELAPTENMNKCKISDDSIPEEQEEDEMQQDNAFKLPVSRDSKRSFLDSKYIWRINLFKTEPFWKSWFENLSKLFLNAPANGRLLLLAGIDRLDKDLTIGQMQGKFGLQVLPQCGHAVHEDVPDKVAEAIATYLIRNKLVEKKKEFEPTFPCC